MSAQIKIDKVRDHLANERTFLAWIRTSISVIVFGFVVAKFGITLREFLSIQNRTVDDSGISLNIGLGFMIMGIFMALMSTVRYQITMRKIDANNFKPTSLVIIFLGVITAIFGGILAIYLIATANTI